MPSYVGEVCVLVTTAFLAYMAYGLKLGTIAQPGPGLWPFLLCMTIVILGSVAGFTNFQEKKRADFALKKMIKPLMAAASIGLYAFAMEYVGYTLPTVALTIFWLKVIGGEKWRITLAISFTVSALFYLIFSYLLGVPFPPDILFG